MLIREARQGDTPGMAKVQVDTKKDFYPSFYPQEVLDKLSYERTAASWNRNLWEHRTPPGAFAYVAEDETQNGEIVGILIGGPDVDDDPEYEAEIYVLYVLPEYHHQGIGRALVRAAARRLAQEGYGNLLIWVLEKNPSRAFYESIGGAVVRTRDMDFNGYVMPEVGYGWPDLPALVQQLEAKDDG